MRELELAKNAVMVLDEKKAAEISLIQVGEKTILADYFVFATGTSSTHVKSLADDVEYELGKRGAKLNHIEGRATDWILLDYGDVVIHVFSKQSRDFYSPERLWADAQQVDISDLITE